MNSALSFIRNSGIFILGAVLSKLVGFLLLPFYTAMIEPAEFGYYDVSLAYVAIFSEVLFFNIWVVILRFMYDFDERDKSKAIRAGAILFGASSIVYLSIALVIYMHVQLPHFWLIVAHGLFQNVSMVIKFAARGYGRNIDFAVAGVIGTLVMAGLNLLLIGRIGLGIEAIYIAMILGFACEVLYLETRVGILKQAWLWNGTEKNRTLLFDMLKYAVPIGVSALCYWFIQSYNRVVISQELTLADNGVFSVAARFGGVIALATVAMTYAWQELAFREQNQNGRFFGRASSVYFTGLLLLISLFLPVIRVGFDFVIHSDYREALFLVPSALLLGVASGYSNFVVNIFYGLKDSRTVVWTLLASSATNFVTVRPFVEMWGLQGANLSATLAFAVNVALLTWFLRRRIALELWPFVITFGVIVGGMSAMVFFFGSLRLNLIFASVSALAALAGALVFVRKIRKS